MQSRIYHTYSINIVLAVVLLFIMGGCSGTDTNTGTDISKGEAEQTMEDFFRALSTADTTLIQQITTDDFILYEHDAIWNRDSLLSLMSATKGRNWEIQDPVVKAEGNLAHIYYYNVSRKPEGRSWLESALLINQKDTVRLAFMHSTKLYLNEQ